MVKNTESAPWNIIHSQDWLEIWSAFQSCLYHLSLRRDWADHVNSDTTSVRQISKRPWIITHLIASSQAYRVRVVSIYLSSQPAIHPSTGPSMHASVKHPSLVVVFNSIYEASATHIHYCSSSPTSLFCRDSLIPSLVLSKPLNKFNWG